jgi:hypothetical protein
VCRWAVPSEAVRAGAVVTKQPTTGAALELSQATDRLTAALALQAMAPSEAHEAAVRGALGDYVTSLGSSTTAMMAGGLVGVYKRLDSLVHQSGDQFERIGFQFRAYNEELNTYQRQHRDMIIQMQALTALVEERIVRPFGELVQRVEDMETGYADLYRQLNDALDPNTPGATVAMVKVQDRVRVLTWLVWGLIAVVIVQGMLLIGHHYYLWERLR